MAKQGAKFKIYLGEFDDPTKSKTITENHPKLTGVTNEMWDALSEQMQSAYGGSIDEATVQSETTVYQAS